MAAAAAAVAPPEQPPQRVQQSQADQAPKDPAAPLPASNSAAPTANGGTPAQAAAKGKGLRALRERLPLRRAFSTRHASVSSPTLSSPAGDNLKESELEEPSSRVGVKPRAKLTAFERFVNAKIATRRGGRKARDAAEEELVIVHSPIVLDLAPAPSSLDSSASPGGEKVLPDIPESTPDLEVPTEEARETGAGIASRDADPEPLPLARKIQSLLSSLPPFLSPLSPASVPPTDASGRKSDGEKQQPSDSQPDQDAPSSIDNSRLISLLSSPSMMNGSLARGRQSVWALLDNLRLKSLSPSPSPGTRADADTSSGTSVETDTSEQTTVEDDDSVMFYGPLIPDATSEVELARSEIVSVDENGTIVEVVLDDAPLPANAQPRVRFGGIWPFAGRPAPSSPSPGLPAAKPKVLTEKRVWVPSTTKLSLQVMWWGYRLWLPPPIMNLLNDKEIEAAKLGAMLTAALQWLLNNVPDSALPPTLRPALSLVKSLVPYLGYIGGFVAWSWGGIKGFDVGNGVTLTATWLLPIALIPGTWEDSDVHQPQPQPPSSGSPSSDPGSGPSAPSSGGSPAPGSGPSVPGGDPSAPGSGPDAPGGGSSTPSTPTPASPSPGSSTPTTTSPP